MFLQRNLWIVPLAVVLVSAGLYLLVIGSRASIDQSELLGSWVVHGAVMVGIAVGAVIAYWLLRRRHAAGDEAASARDERRGPA